MNFDSKMSIFNRFLRLQIFLVSCLVLLTACSQPSPEQYTNFFDEDVHQSFDQILNILDNQDIEELNAVLIDEVREIEGFESQLEIILKHMAGAKDAQIVFAQNRKNEETDKPYPIYYAAFEFPDQTDGYIFLDLFLQKDDANCCLLRHIRFKRTETQLSTQNDFKQQKLTFKRLMFIGAMVLNLCFIVGTLIIAACDKKLRYKVLWLLFISLGTYGVILNWTSGDISANFFSFTDSRLNFSIIKFQLFGGSFVRAGSFQPWLLEVSFPLGAAIYWFKRSRRKGVLSETSQS